MPIMRGRYNDNKICLSDVGLAKSGVIEIGSVSLAIQRRGIAMAMRCCALPQPYLKRWSQIKSANGGGFGQFALSVHTCDGRLVFIALSKSGKCKWAVRHMSGCVQCVSRA